MLVEIGPETAEEITTKVLNDAHESLSIMLFGALKGDSAYAYSMNEEEDIFLIVKKINAIENILDDFEYATKYVPVKKLLADENKSVYNEMNDIDALKKEKMNWFTRAVQAENKLYEIKKTMGKMFKTEEA